MNKFSIILGALYGDEGKGSVANNKCSDAKNPLVVRFSGGHQVGHTVVYNDIRHVFSNFGSGTLKGVPTYWSEYCTVDPMGVFKEGNILRKLGPIPMVYYNANALITTPFDKLMNLNDANFKINGTVGVGFGTTIQRNEDHYHLHMRDLLYPTIRDEKIRLIRKYYKAAFDLYDKNYHRIIDEEELKFKEACDDLIQKHEIVNSINDVYFGNGDLIFEGSQGIMLDMDHGFFPNVTRSNTTSKNAFKIIDDIIFKDQHNIIDTYYITRAYQTRHGNGFLSNEDLDNSIIKINPLETNVDTGYQGKFRRSILDYNQLKYAISCDKYYNKYSNSNLVITCTDHINGKIPITINGDIKYLSPTEISNWLKTDSCFTSNSDKGDLEIQ